MAQVNTKQNQTRNSRGTVWREKVQQMQSTPLNYDLMSSRRTKRGIFVLHWLHGGIWESMTRWDNHTTTTVEDRWKRSTRDLKHLQGTGSNNASLIKVWEISQFKKKIIVVSHKDVFSSDPFSPYSEIITQNPQGYQRIKAGGQIIHHLRYADDTVLILESKEDLQQLLDILNEEAERKGLNSIVKR